MPSGPFANAGSTSELNILLSGLPFKITALSYRNLCAKICCANDFEIKCKLSDAEGSYGVVVHAVRKSDGKEFAMKFFGYTTSKPDPNWIDREIENMVALLGISGVVQIEGVFMDSVAGYISRQKPKIFVYSYPVIVMELLRGGDLYNRIERTFRAHNHFSERHAASIFKQFILSLHRVHMNGEMINRDLKIENMVFESIQDYSPVKIVDFGLAVFLSKDQEYSCFPDLQSTPSFHAPETLNTSIASEYCVYKFGRASDMWQAGCVLFIMLHAYNPFDSTQPSDPVENMAQMRARIQHGRYHQVNTALSPLSRDLIAQLLEPKPSMRLSASQVLQHPWITKNCPDHVGDVASCAMSSTNTGSEACYDADTHMDCIIGTADSEYANRIIKWRYRKQLKIALMRTVAEFKERRALVTQILSNQSVGFLHDEANDGRGDSCHNLHTPAHSLSRSSNIFNFSEDEQGIIGASSAAGPSASASAVNPFDCIDLTTFNELRSNFTEKLTSSAAEHGWLSRTESHGINYHEFCAVLESTSSFPALSRHQYGQLFRVFDQDDNKLVDSKEFLSTISSMRSDTTTNFSAMSNVRVFFDIFNLSGKEQICREDLQEMMASFLVESSEVSESAATDAKSQLLDSCVLDELFKDIDTNGDNEISLAEFEAFLLAVLAESLTL